METEHMTYPEGFGLASGEHVRRVRHANMRAGLPYPHFTAQSLQGLAPTGRAVSTSGIESPFQFVNEFVWADDFALEMHSVLAGQHWMSAGLDVD